MVTLLAYLSGLALLAAGVALGRPLSGSLNLTAGCLVLGTLVLAIPFIVMLMHTAFWLMNTATVS